MKKYPKLLVASDGRHTAILLDGVVLGRGIERLELSTTDRNGVSGATIRLLEVDVATAKVDSGENAMDRVLDALGKE